MGIRKPTRASLRDPAELATDLQPVQASQSLCYTCRLVTPMYGGGVRAGEVDAAMPIRATAIRGQLRFWWRLLDANPGNDNAASAAQFQREREIWGGLGGSDTLARSRVRVAVNPLRLAVGGEWSEFKPRTASATQYVARTKPGQSYALFPASSIGGNAPLLLQEKFAFELHVSVFPGQELTVEEWAGVQQALRWWAAFGGIGARARRGLGALKVEVESGRSLAPPSDDEVNAAGCTLALGGKQFKDPIEAWEFALEQLQLFRQGSGIGRNEKALGSNSPAGRSRWPEPDSIRRITERHASEHSPSHPLNRSFPRAAFGLPIMMHFKDEKTGDPHDTSIEPVTLTGADGQGEQARDRLASPLILRPMLVNGHWYAGALVLPMRHLARMAVRVMAGKVELFRTDPGDWWRSMDASKVEPMQGRSDHPVLAFLDFLRSQATKSAGTAAAPPPLRDEVFERPKLSLQKNGAIKVDHPKRKTVYLTGDDAKRCLESLSDYARKRLSPPDPKPFDRLQLTLRGNVFVSLMEHKE